MDELTLRGALEPLGEWTPSNGYDRLEAKYRVVYERKKRPKEFVLMMLLMIYILVRSIIEGSDPDSWIYQPEEPSWAVIISVVWPILVIALAYSAYDSWLRRRFRSRAVQWAQRTASNYYATQYRIALARNAPLPAKPSSIKQPRVLFGRSRFTGLVVLSKKVVFATVIVVLSQIALRLLQPWV
jgi:hypothetical protein